VGDCNGCGRLDRDENIYQRLSGRSCPEM